MAVRTSVTTDTAGRRVVAKVAANPSEAARLEHEAAQLDAARHPGVVELVGVDGHGVGAILLTAHVEGPTLAQVGRLPLEEGAGLLAAMASTLADLHELDLVHGAVVPEHVVVGPGGRPVLCGLAYGGPVGGAPPPLPNLPAAFIDPARAGAAPLTPAFDVFHVGALARFLAPDPPPGHVLGRVAAEGTRPDPADRPSARAIAESLHEEVPGARLPRGLATPAPPRPTPALADPLSALRRHHGALGTGHRSRRPRPVALVAGVAAVGLVAGAAVLAGARPGPAPAELVAQDPPHEARPDPTTTRVGPAPSSTSTVVLRRPECPTATGLLQADIDDDGCPEPLRYADGVLEAGSVRWALGRPGDQVATGDWACQGRRTVALFRPSTGELFRFDGWARPGADLTATVVARVQGGQALRAADVDRDGCHEAVVERATGAAEVVRLSRARP